MPPEAGDAVPPDFTEQCQTLLDREPPVVSSIMGLFASEFVRRLREKGIRWFATATTLAEALEAERAGADAVIALGCKAGGHRGSFDAAAAERQCVGLFALLPCLADHLGVPVIAAGGRPGARGLGQCLSAAVKLNPQFHKITLLLNRYGR